MTWETLFPKNVQPSMAEIAAYIGKAVPLWQELLDGLKAQGAKPKLFYSVCSGKPGWNVKFQKGGQALGTFYPEEDAFSVFLVIPYKYENQLPEAVRGRYQGADDYMKMGKWMMFQMNDKASLDVYWQLVSVKLPIKG